jgi:hypothetical protein
MRVLRFREEWKKPMHWSGFLVVGASTRLPRGAADEPMCRCEPGKLKFCAENCLKCAEEHKSASLCRCEPEKLKWAGNCPKCAEEHREGREAADERPDTEDIWQGQESDSGPRNWIPPEKNTDFARYAGQSEKAALRALPFNLVLRDKETKVQKEIGEEIGGTGGPRHGLTPEGFLTPDALETLGVRGYSDLWGQSGEVVTKAQELLKGAARASAKTGHDSHSIKASNHVRHARDQLKEAVYYRQLDVMTYRFRRSVIHNAKEAEKQIKEVMLRKYTKMDILEEYRKDCEDLAIIRRQTITVGTVPAIRQRCLSLTCSWAPNCFTALYNTPKCFTDEENNKKSRQHKAQLDACHQAMTELNALLACHKCLQADSAEEVYGRFDHNLGFHCTKCWPSNSPHPRRPKGR